MSIRWTGNQSPGTGWWEMEFGERSQYWGDGDLWFDQGEPQRPDSLQSPLPTNISWREKATDAGLFHKDDGPVRMGPVKVSTKWWVKNVLGIDPGPFLRSVPLPVHEILQNSSQAPRISWTWYASSPSMMRGGGPWFRASSRSPALLGALAALNKETWKVGEIQYWGGKAKR